MAETEFRISWEMGDGMSAATSRRWAPVERVTSNEADARDQYEVLKGWAEAGIEPVRDVKLEIREPSEWRFLS